MNQTCAASDVHLRGGLTLPVLGAIRRAGMPRWTPENRPLIDTSKPAIN